LSLIKFADITFLSPSSPQYKNVSVFVLRI